MSPDRLQALKRIVQAKDSLRSVLPDSVAADHVAGQIIGRVIGEFLRRDGLSRSNKMDHQEIDAIADAIFAEAKRIGIEGEFPPEIEV